MDAASDSQLAGRNDDATSPTDDIFDCAATSTATFPNTAASASAIQPPARLQRSCIPPPIDTENTPASGIEPLIVDDAGDHAKVADTECAHIGVAFSKNRRYRRTMEDAHYHKYDFGGVAGQLFMAIFDGHAGKQAALWCGEHFADIFLELREAHKGDSVPELFNRTFIEADRRLAADVQTHSGCTVAAAFLEISEVAGKRTRTLYCANVGDARAVLSRGGTAKRLTYDHKGDDAHEIERISEAGGYVFNGRVNGILAVTRALGDSSLKQFVIGNPYTTETRLDDQDDVLILACDGLWDVCSDQEAVDL
ncbi:phosphatase 2C, partial [Coemansia sp. RSA 2618]